MSLKGRLRIEVIFSVLQNTLEGYSGVFKNTFKWRGGELSLQACSLVWCLLRAEGRYSLESLG